MTMKKPTRTEALPPTNCSALVRAAKKCARLSAEFSDADAELKRQMTARYGDHDEMADPIVDVTQYGGIGHKVTLQWLDEEMASDGYLPNSPVRPQNDLQKSH